ncbi:Tripartite ATP-independent transporter DctP family solute receptor OS=Castellaniella defragrans OX=75697 GN=HNR28_003420 PE=3 SV=1 [Castellaniella defragrans]
MHKKFITRYILAAALIACASPVPAKTVLKLGHVWPATEIHAKAAEIFAKEVEKNSGGDVQVQIFGGSTLGSDRELVEGLKLGTTDIWVGGAGVLSAVSNTAKIFTQHFMISDIDHFKRVYEGPIGKQISNSIDKESGYDVIAYWVRGPRWLTTKKPVNQPQDLSGMKIRVPDSPVFVASWKALGAAPTPMNFGEVFTALQQGVIDGQENPLSLILTSKFSEVTKYLVKTEHVYEPIAVVMNTKRLHKLPQKDQQAIIQAANDAAAQYAAAEVAKGEDTFARELQQQGMTLIKVDKAPFRARVAKVVEQGFPYLTGLYNQITAD